MNEDELKKRLVSIEHQLKWLPRIPALQITLDSLREYWRQVGRKGPKDCWLWKGPRDPNGYPVFWIGNEDIRARRFALALDGRELPVDENAMSDCESKLCVNPRHLYRARDR